MPNEAERALLHVLRQRAALQATMGGNPPVPKSGVRQALRQEAVENPANVVSRAVRKGWLAERPAYAGDEKLLMLAITPEGIAHGVALLRGAIEAQGAA